MTIKIRPIQENENQPIRSNFTSIMQEYGAIGEGYGSGDSDLNNMFEFYSEPRREYFVIVENDQVIGGGGYCEWTDSHHTAELRKFFLLKEYQGKGLGKQLLETVEAAITTDKFHTVYLESMESMKSALALYEKFGYKRLEAPCKGSVHHGCDVWMEKKL